MSDDHILYACVAGGTDILSEWSFRSGNFKEIVHRLLANIGPNNNQMSYSFQDHYFHFKVANGLTYLCLCEETFGRRIPFMFLDQIQELFEPIRNKTKQVEMFDSTLKSQMRRYSKTKVVVPKIAEIQQELDEVKGIMVKNIDSLLKRGETLEILEDTTELLETEAATFKGGAQQVKKNILKWYRLRIILIVGGVLVIIGLGVALGVWYGCGGVDWWCGGGDPGPEPEPGAPVAPIAPPQAAPVEPPISPPE